MESALEIRKQLRAHNTEQERKGGLKIEIGIGIATGRVVAGYAGTQSRATYLCVGDIVNLSARLEGHTKNTGKHILIDESTYNELEGAVPAVPMGQEIFKGKTIPVQVYAVESSV